MAQVGSVGVNAFGVICYVASFSVAIFYGAAQGLQPLFGQSYGAKKENDLKFYFRSGMLICLIGSALITLLLCLGCGGICGLFGGMEGFALSAVQWIFAAVMIIGIAMVGNLNPLDIFKKKEA